MKNSKLNRAIEYIKEDFVWASLLAFVFFCGVSMPLARIFLLISAVGSLVRAIRQHSWARISRPTIGWLTYFVLALVVSIIATCCLNDPQLNPSKGLGKIDKLIWYIGIPIVALSVNSKERFVQLLRWYVIGCLIGAIIVIISYPLKSWIMCNIPKVSHMKNPAVRETIPLLAQWLYFVTEFLGVGDGVVHFPVTRNNRLSHIRIPLNFSFFRLGKQCREELCLQKVLAMRRHPWRCATSYPQSLGFVPQPRCHRHR